MSDAPDPEAQRPAKKKRPYQKPAAIRSMAFERRSLSCEVKQTVGPPVGSCQSNS